MIYSLLILFAIAPAYVARFGRLDLLELAVAAFWIIFFFWILARKEFKNFIAFAKSQPKTLNWAIFLFLLAAAISALISPDKTRATGLFIAYFLEPALTYFPAKYIFLQNEKNKKLFIGLLLVLAAVFSIYAILQYFTLLGLPSQWWGNANEPKRALSVFEYPNAFALYLAPLLAFLLPFVFNADSAKKNLLKLSAFAIGLAGLILSMSRGGWAGLFIAALAFIFFQKNKNITRMVLAGIFIIAAVVLIIPNLRYRVLLPFVGEKSTVSRFSLWHTADKMIKSSPVLGKGLYGFKSDFNLFNTDPNLASLNYPHNIFLNFWVETGLLGMLSFLYISFYFFIKSDKKNPYGLGVALFLIAIYIHGLVDAPYLKNDLALIFWVVLATAPLLTTS